MRGTRRVLELCPRGGTTEDRTVQVIGFTHLQRDSDVGDSDYFVNGMYAGTVRVYSRNRSPKRDSSKRFSVRTRISLAVMNRIVEVISIGSVAFTSSAGLVL